MNKLVYNNLRASRIKSSTEASGCCFKSLLRAFSAAFLLKPKVTNAVNASSFTVLLGTPTIYSTKSVFLTLSLRSTTRRCAVLVPMPLTP